MAGGGVSLTLSLIYWKDSVPTYQGNSGENLKTFSCQGNQRITEFSA